MNLMYLSRTAVVAVAAVDYALGNFRFFAPCAVMAGIGHATSVIAALGAKNCDLISSSLL